MLIDCFGKIGDFKAVKALRAFLNSVFYPVFVVALMVCANWFSFELPVYYCYVLLGALCILFDEDMRNLIPPMAACYMTVSAENNPAAYPPSSAAPSMFYSSSCKIQLVVLLSLSAVLVAGRLVSLLVLGERKKLPALTFGFLALGLGYVLGGLFTEFYGFRTAFFGFAEIASLCGLYFLFYYGVNWKRTEKRMWAVTFCAIGCGLLLELGGIYIKSGFLQNPGADRGVLATGWGMYNNVGCMFAMCLPASFYLAAKEKHGWVFTVLGCLQAVGLIFTQSRGSILGGGIIGVVCVVLLLVKCEKKARKFHLIVFGAFLAVAALIAAVFWEKVSALFVSLLERTFGTDPLSARTLVFESAWKQFRSAPACGVGFYQADRTVIDQWGNLPPDSFLPPRYHNTVLQLLASGGIVAFLGYLFHRVQTLLLLFRRPCPEKTFIALCVFALLLTSLMDCHFFNFGPGILYGILLACAEGENLRTAPPSPPKKKKRPA